MNEIDYKPPLLYLEDEWGMLTPGEKALMVSYRRMLRKNLKVNAALIMAVNDIHERYPEFHIGCMPAEHKMKINEVYEYEYNSPEPA